MGLLSGLTGGSGGGMSTEETAQYIGMLQAEKKVADEDEARYQALKLQEEEERNALQFRESSMQGGGRTGLMFNQNQSGVTA